MLVVFIVGHLIMGFAPNFWTLLIGRVVAAVAHGVFFAIAASIAVNLAEQGKGASAIAFIFSGFTVATAIGAPFGTYLSDTFGWRVPFLGIVVVSLVSLAMTAIQVPSQKATTAPSVKEQLKLAANGKILLVLLVTILGYGGTFATFTYLSPILQEITGISSKYVSIVLVGYGVMIAVGNSLGGKFGDKNPAKAVFWIFTAQSAVLLGFHFTQSNLVLGLISVALMGLAAFMSVPVLQVLDLDSSQKVCSKRRRYRIIA